MRKDIVVIDTNVLLAAFNSRKGQSYKLLEKIIAGSLKMAISVPLLFEYEMILKKQLNKEIFSDTDIDSIIDFICAVSEHVRVFWLWRPWLKDPFDDHVLELALAANCKYIITYNLKDFKNVKELGIIAISPKDYLERGGF